MNRVTLNNIRGGYNLLPSKKFFYYCSGATTLKISTDGSVEKLDININGSDCDVSDRYIACFKKGKLIVTDTKNNEKIIVGKSRNIPVFSIDGSLLFSGYSIISTITFLTKSVHANNVAIAEKKLITYNNNIVIFDENLSEHVIPINPYIVDCSIDASVIAVFSTSGKLIVIKNGETKHITRIDHMVVNLTVSPRGKYVLVDNTLYDISGRIIVPHNVYDLMSDNIVGVRDNEIYDLNKNEVIMRTATGTVNIRGDFAIVEEREKFDKKTYTIYEYKRGNLEEIDRITANQILYSITKDMRNLCIYNHADGNFTIYIHG